MFAEISPNVVAVSDVKMLLATVIISLFLCAIAFCISISFIIAKMATTLSETFETAFEHLAEQRQAFLLCLQAVIMDDPYEEPEDLHDSCQTADAMSPTGGWTQTKNECKTTKRHCCSGHNHHDPESTDQSDAPPKQ